MVENAVPRERDLLLVSKSHQLVMDGLDASACSAIMVAEYDSLVRKGEISILYFISTYKVLIT